MNFLSGIFGRNEEDRNASSFWKKLEEISLENLVTLSYEKPIVIFKHSTRCSISRFVWNQFQKESYNLQEKIDFYYLDLLEFRTISNEIAEIFHVVHQSPQILLIKNGVCVYNASHERIDAEALEPYL